MHPDPEPTCDEERLGALRNAEERQLDRLGQHRTALERIGSLRAPLSVSVLKSALERFGAVGSA